MPRLEYSPPLKYGQTSLADLLASVRTLYSELDAARTGIRGLTIGLNLAKLDACLAAAADDMAEHARDLETAQRIIDDDIAIASAFPQDHGHPWSVSVRAAGGLTPVKSATCSTIWSQTQTSTAQPSGRAWPQRTATLSRGPASYAPSNGKRRTPQRNRPELNSMQPASSPTNVPAQRPKPNPAPTAPQPPAKSFTYTTRFPEPALRAYHQRPVDQIDATRTLPASPLQDEDQGWILDRDGYAESLIAALTDRLDRSLTTATPLGDDEAWAAALLLEALAQPYQNELIGRLSVHLAARLIGDPEESLPQL